MVPYRPPAEHTGEAQISWKAVAVDLAISAAGYGLLYLCCRGLMDMVDPLKDDKAKAREAKAAWAERLGPVSYTHLTLPTILLV